MPVQKYQITGSKRKSSRKLPKLLLFGGGFIILAVVIIFILEITNTTHIFHKKTVPPIIPVSSHKTATPQSKSTASPAAAGQTATGTQNSTDSSPAKQISTGSRSSGTTQSLVQPYGSFVSTHSPAPNSAEESVCDTTPGADCYIRFTNTASNVTTQLATQTTDSDGSTSWPWNTKTLTSGEWQVTAVASLNGQTQSTTDSVKLEIQ